MNLIPDGKCGQQMMVLKVGTRIAMCYLLQMQVLVDMPAAKLSLTAFLFNNGPIFMYVVQGCRGSDRPVPMLKNTMS